LKQPIQQKDVAIAQMAVGIYTVSGGVKTMIDIEPKVITFYRVSEDYGCFSNFAPYPISMDGKVWLTTEHYFQAQKFEDSEHQEKIRLTKSALIAARLGRSRSKPIRQNWEAIKVSLMTEAVRAKFTQNEKARQILLSTGDVTIVEHSKKDAYWGDGGDGSGQNILGKILMDVRKELQEQN
jgi:N-glycosidase YbiA